MGFAQGKAESGDFDAAIAALKKLKEQLLVKAPPTGPTGKVAAAVLRSELHTIRMNAARGLTELAGLVKNDPDPRAEQAETLIKTMAVSLPTELETVMEQLDAAVQSGDSGAVSSIRAAVQQNAKEWMTFLQTHAHEIRFFENNPWNVAVAIDQPVRASLMAILKATR
jgi:hypothetical protein